MHATLGRARSARHEVEEAARLAVVDQREEFLELVDDDEQPVSPVLQHLANTCGESIGVGERGGERSGRGRGGHREGSVERAERVSARLHQRDRDLRVVAPKPRNQTRLNSARLAGAARPDHSGEGDVVEHASEEPVDELLLTEVTSMIRLAERSKSDVRVLDPPIARGTRRRRIRRSIEVGVLEQDLLLEPAQPRRGDDTEVLVQEATRALEGPQRVRLTTAPVQRHHVQRPEFLAVRVLSRQPIELGHDVAVPAGREPGLHHLLHCCQMEFSQPGDLHVERLLATDVLERRTPPQRERVAQHRGGALGIGRYQCSSSHDSSLEVQNVEGVGVDTDPVAGPFSVDDRPEDLAELRHIRLHGVSGSVRRLIAPQPVDQSVDRHHAVRVSEQHREHEALLGASERRLGHGLGRRARTGDRHDPCRTEHLEAHRSMVRAAAETGVRSISGATAQPGHVAERIGA